jgi:hypothetical protein
MKCSYFPNDDKTWYTSCDEWQVDDEFLEENGIKICRFCGKEINFYKIKEPNVQC